jgi:hypothetical protein
MSGRPHFQQRDLVLRQPVPDLVDDRHLDIANAFKSLSYILSGVIWLPLAKFFISLFSTPNVVFLDGLS